MPVVTGGFGVDEGGTGWGGVFCGCPATGGGVLFDSSTGGEGFSKASDWVGGVGVSGGWGEGAFVFAEFSAVSGEGSEKACSEEKNPPIRPNIKTILQKRTIIVNLSDGRGILLRQKMVQMQIERVFYSLCSYEI